MKHCIAAALLAFVAASPTYAQWKYGTAKDDMTDVKRPFAYVVSTNSFQLAFPYHGGTRARLTVRQSDNPKEPDVWVEVSRGQLLCGLEECEVKLRFDDGEPIDYGGTTPEDHSTDWLWIRSESTFNDEVFKAKKLRVALPFYQNGVRVFTFNVAGLRWPQNKK